MPQDGKGPRKGRAVEVPQSAPPVRTRLNLSAQQREILGEWVAETATPGPDVQPERPPKTHPMASRHRPAAPVDAEHHSDVPMAAEGPVLGCRISILTDWGLAPLLKLKKTPWLLPPLPAWQLVI